MASWQARVAGFLVRRRVRAALGDMSDIARVRDVFRRPLPHPGGARFTPATVGGVKGEWVDAIDGTATLLYLHGGGFVGCSPMTHRPLTVALARRGFRVFVPDYRLAPEHPFPAAIDDATAVWRALRAEQMATGGAQRMVVSGDSAGGNLALALMLRLRDAGEPLPAAAALFSPATDLAGESASMVENAGRDAMFRADGLHHLREAYLAGADPMQPLASPVRADLRGLPPLLVHVGESELLRDDSVRLAQKARADDVPVQLRVWPVVPHVWQLIWQLPEAKASVREAAAFLHDAVTRAGMPADARGPEDLDVVIVGAGLSGIGAAAHLQAAFPQRRYAILEGRSAIGGTWDLFRYPGIRSDSDMYTLGYEFKPWRDGKAIADGPSIRAYVQETARERGIDRHIRFGHKLLKAEWSSAQGRWLLEIGRGDGKPPVRLACRFLWMCSGYYSYAQGHRPAFPGEDQFQGPILQPQFWPESLDYAGKRVVVIGSGATAVTLVPEMARKAAHVTMLQRSPTYVVSRPAVDRIAERLKRRLPAMLAYRLVRTKNVLLQQLFYRLARKWPQRIAQRMVQMAAAELPPGYDTAHFTPRYKPWDQRVCLVPDADLFRAISAGTASVVTDTIATFTAHGIQLASGAQLEADIVVAATGLQLNVLGDVRLSIDGRPCDLSKELVYKGMMFSGVPNLASTFGYTNASWTLKADLTARYVCRLLARMDATGDAVAVAVRDPAVREQPFMDFSSGYVQRALAMLPKQGDRKPWKLAQNYMVDLLTLRFSPLHDGALRLLRQGQPLPG
jgi:cation diffusion facilitator CzcD-associated flavoprotein CzcO/acetyl esterase/lipase